ncbi:hypothetical protein U1Q18_012650 [Sarracenia purpurea var. burkii]
MGSSSRSLQLKLMNCKALQGFNFFQKLSVYAVASLASDDPSNKQLAQQQRTPADTQGDKDPDWNNHEMFFDLGFGGRDGCEDDFDDHHFLHFDLRTELAVFGDKSLGEVHVLLKDLINQQEETSNEIVRFVSYEVRTSDKKPNGVLSFSYKVVHKHNDGGSTSGSQNCNLGMSDRGSPEKKNKKKNGQIDGYNPIVNHVNDDLFNHHHSNPDEKAEAEVHCPSYFPSPYAHSPSRVMEDQYLQIPFGQNPGTPVAPHRIHYPSLETPHPGPAPAGEGYLNHPRPDDRFHYLPPTPQPPPPPAGEGYLNHPRPDDRFHYLPPTPQPPPPPAAPVFLPPFPPPPPYHHHRHHHHHHNHHNDVGVAQGAAYQPMSTWGHDYQPYPKPPDPSEVGGNYIHAYPYN